MRNRLLGLPEVSAGASQEHSADERGGEEEDAGEPEMSEVDEEPPVQEDHFDVRDVVRRRRGRPKKRQGPHVPQSRSCVLCGASHGIEQCPKYPAFAAAVEHNESIQDEVHSRCSVCRGIGHNRKTCPYVYRKPKGNE